MRRVALLNSSLGHSAKVYRDVEWNEYRAKFYDTDGSHLTDADYHTNDLEDAMSTARHILTSFKALKE